MNKLTTTLVKSLMATKMALSTISRMMLQFKKKKVVFKPMIKQLPKFITTKKVRKRTSTSIILTVLV